jgi:acyl carrier protein
MTNQEKLCQAIADVLQVDVASVSDGSSPDTLPSWDSLAVVSLVSELEAVFDVKFDILEIADFRSVLIIKTILMEKGVAF